MPTAKKITTRVAEADRAGPAVRAVKAVAVWNA